MSVSKAMMDVGPWHYEGDGVSVFWCCLPGSDTAMSIFYSISHKTKGFGGRRKKISRISTSIIHECAHHEFQVVMAST